MFDTPEHCVPCIFSRQELCEFFYKYFEDFFSPYLVCICDTLLNDWREVYICSKKCLHFRKPSKGELVDVFITSPSQCIILGTLLCLLFSLDDNISFIVFLSFFLFVFLSLYRIVFVSFCLSVFLFFCASIFLSVFLSLIFIFYININIIFFSLAVFFFFSFYISMI